MNFYYFDTSSLIKQYVNETGTSWINSIFTAVQPHIFISQLTIVEIACAFARRLREQLLSAELHTMLMMAFDYDVSYRYRVIGITTTLIETAKLLSTRHPLRACDAVQLASAWLIRQYLPDDGQISFTFSSADDRLNRAALAEGLSVQNPLHHA